MKSQSIVRQGVLQVFCGECRPYRTCFMRSLTPDPAATRLASIGSPKLFSNRYLASRSASEVNASGSVRVGACVRCRLCAIEHMSLYIAVKSLTYPLNHNHIHAELCGTLMQPAYFVNLRHYNMQFDTQTARHTYILKAMLDARSKAMTSAKQRLV